jgi:hypothetical protein
MRLLGDDGIVALRWGNVVLAAITVVLATWTVTRDSARRTPGAALLVALIFTLWMVPGYKVSDSFALVLLLFSFTRLIRRPQLARYFQAGVCWGVAAAIGINHALYGSIAGLLTFLYLHGRPQPARAATAGALGAVLGYSPVLALHAFAPGFTAAFIDGIRQLFEYGTTNLALPFPSLLAILEVRRMGYLVATTETLSALLFLCVPVLWAVMAWRLRGPHVRAGVAPVIPAALVLSLPYAHYAYSRADPLHVAVSILPMLAAGLAWAMQAPPVRRRLIMIPILGISLLFTAHMHPAYYFLRGFLSEAVVVGRDRLLVSPQTAVEVRTVQKVATAAGPQPFFAGPYLPGAYAVAKRKSPAWEIYMLFPATPPRQRAEIERLRSAGIRYALITEARADGRADLGLDRTHPLVLAYLRKCLPKPRIASGGSYLNVLTGTGAECPRASY